MPGVYHLPHGVTIAAPGVTLDMGGAQLIGFNYTGMGVTVSVPGGCTNVVVTNGAMSGYYYGLKATDCVGLHLTQLNSSRNWLDPAALTIDPLPPWLNINVVPADYGDRTNLGGGVRTRVVKHLPRRRVLLYG